MPQLHHQYCNNGCLEIALSSDPDVIIVERVCYEMLVGSCGSKHINRYITHRPDGSKLLVLPGSDCEPHGIKTVIHWMEEAHIGGHLGPLPRRMSADFFTMCCAERGLRVLNLTKAADNMRSVAHSFATKYMSAVGIASYKAVLQNMPPHDYFVECLLDLIRSELESIIDQEKKHRN